MGFQAMTRKAPDHEDPDYIRARAYTVIVTLDLCRTRLLTQTANAAAIWKEKLGAVTKEYREIIRDADEKDSQAVKAKSFDKVVELLENRDKIAEEKAEDMRARKAKLALVNEADNEAKSYRPSSAEQATLFEDDYRVAGMPWATDKTLGVIFTALRDLEEAGTRLDDYQAPLLMELAEAEIEGADLGLEASAAIEDDSDVEPFTDEEAGIEDEDDEDNTVDLF